MTTTTSPRITDDPIGDPEQAMRLVKSIDLGMIRMKLADPFEGKGWTDERLDLAVREYRRFLTLYVLAPEAATVPSELVDEVWHAHILDTQAYASDCQNVFGFFLHHFPYFGMRGKADARALDRAYDDTLDRYRAAFGEPPTGVWSHEVVGKRVRKNCKPQRCRPRS